MANTKIPSELIADSSITAAKLADGTITTADIADSNVTTAKIADSNVTTAKIGDAQVTTAKITDANVTTVKIADDAVTTAKMASNSVTSDTIASGITLAGNTTFSGNILKDSGDLTLDVPGAITLDAGTGGTGIVFADDGTSFGSLKGLPAAPTRLIVNSAATAGYLSVAGTEYFAWNTTDIRPAQSNMNLGVDGASWNDLYITGDIKTTSGDLTLDVAGDIILNADGGDWLFYDGSTTLGSIQNDGNNNLVLMSNTNDKDIKFLGIDNSNTITALLLDMSDAGAATFNSTINSGAITSSGTSTFSDITIGGTGDSQALIQMLANSTNGANTIHFGDTASGTSLYTGYINYAHDTNQMQFATNGGNIRMRLDSAGTMILQADGASNLGRIQFSSQAATYQILGGNNLGYLGYKTGGYHRFFGSDGTEDMRIHTNGNVGIGTAVPQQKLDTVGTIRSTHNIVSNSVYKAFSIGSNRTINDYGGLNKEYWAIQLATPGASTDGQSSGHAYGALKFSGVSGSDTTLDDVLVLNYNGNVGIGTTSPGATLHSAARAGTTGLLVAGAASNNIVHFARSDGVPSFIVNSDGKTVLRRSGSAGEVLIFEAGAAQSGGIQVQSTGLGIGGGTQENQIFLKTDGNVGIGTSAVTSPGLWYDATNDYLAISHWATPPTPAAMLHLSDNSNNLDVPQIRIEGRENAGDTKLDISVKDAGVRLNLVENNSDAVNGYGQMVFKTNAAANSSNPTRGGFQFITVADANNLVITNTGKVGIGTDGPISILHLEGNTNSYSTAPILYFGSTSTANAAVRDWAIGPADSNYGDFHIFQGTSTGADARGSTQVKFTINSSGNVGIGERTPNSRLTVANTAAGDGSNIADFVGSDTNQRLIVANFTCGSDEDRVGLIWENQGVALWRNWMDDAGNLRLKSSNPTHDHDGKRVVTESYDTGTSGGFLEQERIYPGNVASYTGDLEGGVNKGGTQFWIFSIQGDNTWRKVLTNMHDMTFEMYTAVGDAASRDQASYSVNMSSPAYGVSSFNQNYYHNGGWNTGSFEYRYVATPGNSTQYDLECKFTSYYASTNVATGYIHIRRLY